MQTLTKKKTEDLEEGWGESMAAARLAPYLNAWPIRAIMPPAAFAHRRAPRARSPTGDVRLSPMLSLRSSSSSPTSSIGSWSGRPTPRRCRPAAAGGSSKKARSSTSPSSRTTPGRSSTSTGEKVIAVISHEMNPV
ncbi:putative SWI/SNF-related matrix-associated actin-dependent regulator of chromatin subfamily A member 3-like 3 [Iris pallida]|uniref:SWI/SNF-related matrix-associated actin-dependent regulator of chromatin subfamily A member 3-like 3 n=1 Tax=Iris pallida TaxID=29817 RepID=A0AAX6FML1_IRIPA|nr:putative SWI/SNF-related matrix-associated actin-dependent regulator of chromatin subfamily A member 3-like 3 [Iris pallida]